MNYLKFKVPHLYFRVYNYRDYLDTIKKIKNKIKRYNDTKFNSFIKY